MSETKRCPKCEGSIENPQFVQFDNDCRSWGKCIHDFHSQQPSAEPLSHISHQVVDDNKVIAHPTAGEAVEPCSEHYDCGDCSRHLDYCIAALQAQMETVRVEASIVERTSQPGYLVESLTKILRDMAASPLTILTEHDAKVRRETIEESVRACIDMATRYDQDIEGCDADELSRYSEGISCCFRLAYIIKYGKFPPEGDAWSAEFAEIAKQIVVALRAKEQRNG